MLHKQQEKHPQLEKIIDLYSKSEGTEKISIADFFCK